MGSIVSYSIMSGIVLVPLYLIVKLLLSDYARPGFNRAVILASYTIAVLVPVMVSIHGASMPHVEIEMPSSAGIVVTDTVDGVSSMSFREIATLTIVILYFVGLLFCLLREVCSWIRLRRLLRGCRCIRLADGRRLLLHDRRDMSPFSWCNVIVMSRTDYEDGGDIIIMHESRHLDSRHWIDLVFAELVSLFIWYNPAGWLMKDELQTIHEYEADEAVMQNGVNIKEYQLLIIKKAVGGRLPSITNSLEQSNLSKRIKMMLRKDSSSKPGWRAIAVVPAVAVSALVLNVDVVADTISSLSDVKVTNYIPSVQEPASSELQLVAHAPAPAETPQSDEEVLTSVEEMPRFPGGEAEMMKHIARNIRYPKEAMEQNVQGRVIVRFVVTDTGKVGAIEIVRGNDLLNQSAIDVVKTLPDFIPGKVNGKPVNVWYTIPITFRLSDDKAGKKQNDEEIPLKIEATLTINHNNPLVVVDGTPRDINDVKPDDIESITVLKDDKAKQLYGEAGTNGVILITTKKQKSAN